LNQAEMIPNDWHLIWQDTGERGETQRVTIRLDRDVVRFFKAMGPGYQTRMNRVLRAFMLTRLARIVDGPEDAAR
ncbi:MAG: BrnA antitoxin family protein, partial [Pseudomonadota bacterium]